MNNKKSIIERLELLKIEAGLSDKSFKESLAFITGKTPRTIRRWFSLENNIHDHDIERISKYFGKHTHWLRYGDLDNNQSIIDQIMHSNYFGALIFKDNKVEAVNFKFLEMMGVSHFNLRKQDIFDHILSKQSEVTIQAFHESNKTTVSLGASVGQFSMLLADQQIHTIESTSLNLNNGRILRIFFDQGLSNTLASKTIQSNIKTTDPEDTLRILFVDDDVALCQLFSCLLSTNNYNVNTFSCSLQALNDFKQNYQHYDVIISDIIMPDLSGDKFVDECQKIAPDMPVILCTGYTEQLRKNTAEDYGVSHYLQKPINTGELLNLLSNLH